MIPFVCLAYAYSRNNNFSCAKKLCTRDNYKLIAIMKRKENYNSPNVTVTSSKLRTSILAGSNNGGGKVTGNDFEFGSRERQTNVQTTNID